MSIRKSTFLLSTHATKSTSHSTVVQKSISCQRYKATSLRSYATHHDATPQDNPSSVVSEYKIPRDPYYWPTPRPGLNTPTPYQILSIPPTTPTYAKTPRFYDLVKLYHPDSGSYTPQIPQNVRLDRYRLVISAHALLSNPTKRRAYDLYGAGWAGANSSLPGPGFDMSPEAKEACQHNATWQDWENWYQRFNPNAPPRAPQAPLFLSNAAFVSLVGILAVLAGVGQATRAKESSKNYVYMLDESSRRAKGEVNNVQAEKQGWSREQRIDYFVKEREVGSEVDDEVRKLILNPDICENGEENEYNRRYR